MKPARRLARWLRLIVTCLAFVVGHPAPAVAADVVDQIVLVASDDAREDEVVEAFVAEPPSADGAERPIATRFESPRLVSRRWLANCALLL